MIRTRFIAICALSLVFATGCTSLRETYPGRSADQVWTAMKAVANEPNYSSGDSHKRWTVRENNVWVDEDNRRIEIFRRTTREIYQPMTNPQTQNREWRFSVTLEPVDPPEVKFVSRGFAVPAWAYEEADRYFDDLDAVLSGAPGANSTTAPQTRPKTENEPSASPLH